MASSFATLKYESWLTELSVICISWFKDVCNNLEISANLLLYMASMKTMVALTYKLSVSIHTI